MEQRILVFVYGTLKRGRGNHRLLARSPRLGREVIAGPYFFAHLGGFPGVVKLPQGQGTTRLIGGEVYEVDAETLGHLDGLEGHPNFYCRELVRTRFGDAWVYLLPPTSRYLQMQEVTTPFWLQNDEESQWFAEELSEEAAV